MTVLSYDSALLIALQAHTGQRDKAGEPYIKHPIRVAQGVEYLGEEYQIVALLHDVLEDSDVFTYSYFKARLSEQQYDALVRLTKNTGETRAANYIRVKDNKISRAVKISDTRDNLNLHRIKNRGNLAPKDLTRINEYLNGLNLLEGF